MGDSKRQGFDDDRSSNGSAHDHKRSTWVRGNSGDGGAGSSNASDGGDILHVVPIKLPGMQLGSKRFDLTMEKQSD